MLPSVPRVSSRPRPGAVPAGRIRELLARPPGWTPAPLPDEGARLQDGRAGRDAVSWAGTADTGGLFDGRGELPGASISETGGPVDRPASSTTGRSWHTERPAPPGTQVASSADAEPASTVRPAAFLPVALRTGRLDPGRRGAAALVLTAVLAAVVTGAVVLRGRPQEVLVPEVLSSGSPLPGASSAAGPQAQVVVSISGAVVRPGLVRLPAGSRVDDALRAAGGPTPGTTTGLLNLARRLVDGEQVLVGVDPPGAPGRGGARSGAAGSGAAVTGTGAGAGAGAAGSGAVAPGALLDLNTATASDFDALPGIGPVLAQRIVDWRTEHQRFASVDQLREVTGIGEAKYDDLKDEVTV